ncbi:MAG TPA: IS4 family transposase [Phycisphaerae bacterium]|nr:IS4 family transposase [Phycisphaerae bacterium]
MDTWIDCEVKGCRFPDQRLGKRLHKVLGSLSRGMGNTIPLACQDWAGTKAAYRFLDNPRVDESAILAGHFEATCSRFTAASGRVLVLHDTTELSFQRKDHGAIGRTCKTFAGRDKNGRPRIRTVCGLLMHSSLVVTEDGVPLGFAAIKFWTRKKFKGTNALKGKTNSTRIPIEMKESYRWVENVKQSTQLLGDPRRCVHIGDRESDIYELFCAAKEAGTFFLVRTCVDRLAEDGHTTVETAMKIRCVRGTHRIEVRDANGKVSHAKLKIKFGRIKVLPPIGKHKRYPALPLTVIYAYEAKAPKGRERIEWKLLTNLPVRTLRAAIEKLDWYAMRWKIEICQPYCLQSKRSYELPFRRLGTVSSAA